MKNKTLYLSLILKLLNEGKSVGLITDAGTPGISDPGEEIVKEAIKNNINIIPIPGACAAINALISSGLSTKEFIFYGFLPLNKKLREEKFNDIQRQNKTIIIYEAPHRIISTLEEIKRKIGNIEIVVAKEITKIHEEFFRGKVEEVIKQLEDAKGEYIIMFEINGKTDEEAELEKLNNMTIEQQYEHYEALGMNKKEIIKKIAKNNNVPKDTIYKKFI